MPIKLAIEIVSPMTPDDHELLTGISVMTLAIANRELASQGFPEAFPPEEEDQEAPKQEKPKARKTAPPAAPSLENASKCGAMEEGSGHICVNDVGHRGRHRFREPQPPLRFN